jgi:WD40 repeat protein
MAVAYLAVSSDGKLLASASFDGTVKVWQLNEVVDEYSKGPIGPLP